MNILALFLSLSLAALIKPTESRVTFLAVGNPGFLQIEGEGGEVSGELKSQGSKITGQLSVDLQAFDTGIALRNQHMKEKYLEVEKFPKASFELTQFQVPSALMKADGEEEADFVGRFKLHGVERDLKGKARVTRKGQSATLETNFKILISDFGIADPGFMGVTMAREVEVKVATTFAIQ